YDFVEKPFPTDKLLVTVQRALEHAELKRENSHLRQRSTLSSEMIGSSSIMQQLSAHIARIAPTNSRILISGPPGSGKELISRLIHERSNRAKGPFVVVNAATME